MVRGKKSWLNVMSFSNILYYTCHRLPFLFFKLHNNLLHSETMDSGIYMKTLLQNVLPVTELFQLKQSAQWSRFVRVQN